MLFLFKVKSEICKYVFVIPIWTASCYVCRKWRADFDKDNKLKPGAPVVLLLKWTQGVWGLQLSGEQFNWVSEPEQLLHVAAGEKPSCEHWTDTRFLFTKITVDLISIN